MVKEASESPDTRRNMHRPRHRARRLVQWSWEDKSPSKKTRLFSLSSVILFQMGMLLLFHAPTQLRFAPHIKCTHKISAGAHI